MSSVKDLLEEWKQRDPFLLDMEGFERFVEERQSEDVEWETVEVYAFRDGKEEVRTEKRKKIIDPGSKPPHYNQRQKYCEKRLKFIVLKAVMEEEFGDLTSRNLSWEEVFKVVEKYRELHEGLFRYGMPSGGNANCDLKRILGFTIRQEEVEREWRLNVRNPIWFADFENAVGAKGRSGDSYWLKAWFYICVKLKKGKEASELVNNLPKELRHPNILPYYIEGRLKSEA